VHIDPATGVITIGPPTKLGTIAITVRVTDNGDPALSDAQTFHVIVPPQVMATSLNDGSTKNPVEVTFLTVAFNDRVTLDAGAISLTRIDKDGGNPVEIAIVSALAATDKAVVTLQFNPGLFVDGNGALAGGTYLLTIHGDRVHDAVTGLALDGDNNGTAGGNGHEFVGVPASRTAGRSVEAIDAVFKKGLFLHPVVGFKGNEEWDVKGLDQFFGQDGLRWVK
jgi:hypothetical protein